MFFLLIFDYFIEFFKKEFFWEKHKTDIFSSISLWKNKIENQKIISFIIKNIKNIFVWIWNYKKILIFLIILSGIYLWNQENIYHFFIWGFFFTSIYFSLDSRLSFLFALFLLLWVPLFLILEKKETAEIYSIYAYYFLVIWVIVSLYESIENKSWKIQKITTFIQTIFSKIWQIIIFIKNHPMIVFYDVVIIFFFYVIGSLYFELMRDYLVNLFQFILGLYIVLKIFWFYFDKQLFDENEKMDLSNFENIQYIIFCFALYVIIFTGLFKWISWEDDMKFIYIFSILWIILYAFLYTNFSLKIQWFLFRNIYGTLSFWVVMIVILSVYYKDVLQYIQLNQSLPWENQSLQSEESKENIIDTPIQELLPEIVETSDMSAVQTWELIEELNFVFDISMFQDNLSVGTIWESVWILQKFLSQHWYYNFDITSNYDETTRVAMAKFLQEKCWWSPVNKWILGPLARECIAKVLKN